MTERFKLSPIEVIENTPFQAGVTENGTGFQHPTADELVAGLRDNPRKFVSDPNLAPVAIVWQLETVQAYHISLGQSEPVALSNRRNRQEELAERLDMIHGESSGTTPNRIKKNLREGLITILKSSTELWDELSDSSRDHVTDTLKAWSESWRNSREITVFEKSNAD